MKTEKLTVKDCMLYPNATLFWDNGKNIKYYNNVFEFVIGLSHLSKKFIPPCKLILRPIESLTEEEIATIGTALGITHKMVMNYVTGLMNYNLDFMKATYVSDKCKEWNIDIYGFIKSGKAVAE